MMKTLFLMVSLSIALLVNGFSSHSGGAAPARIRGVTYRSTSSTCLHAAAAPKKKKASKKKASKKAAEVETFKKPDFVASIQDKTGLSKADSAAALDAVLETISEVRICAFACMVHLIQSLTHLLLFPLLLLCSKFRRENV